MAKFRAFATFTSLDFGKFFPDKFKTSQESKFLGYSPIRRIFELKIDHAHDVPCLGLFIDGAFSNRGLVMTTASLREPTQWMYPIAIAFKAMIVGPSFLVIRKRICDRPSRHADQKVRQSRS